MSEEELKKRLEVEEEEIEELYEKIKWEKGLRKLEEESVEDMKEKIVDIIKEIWVDGLGKPWDLNLEEEATLKRMFKEYLR